jgi:predicted site-specific integrase-resolvase
MTEPLFIRLKKASTMLGGVTPATLRRWDRQGILKMTKLSPRVMGYTQEQLEAFAQGRKTQEGDK